MNCTVDELDLLTQGVMDWVMQDQEFHAATMGAKIKKHRSAFRKETNIDKVFDKLKSKGLPVVEENGK